MLEKFFAHDNYQEALYVRDGVDYGNGKFVEFLVSTFAPDFVLTPGTTISPAIVGFALTLFGRNP